MEYVRAKVAEVDAAIVDATFRERVFDALTVAIAVPQVALSAIIAATALLESLVPADRARAIVGAMGLASIAVHAVSAAVHPSRRGAAWAARRRAMLALRNDMQLALTRELTPQDVAAIAARVSGAYAAKWTPARAHAASSSPVGTSSAPVAGPASTS
jgi:hypothetical protein